ncbi:MAG: hypothetical protein KF861_01445 [Planctomycetaceae bacterium]|nr:hypothetical protein [Planctomycetaceae bacterium]
MAAFSEYLQPNNHVLLSFLLGLLLKMGIWNLFVLRLPTLVSGCFVLVAVDQFSRPLPRTLRTMLTFFLVSMPILLDYFVLARGYAMGLALLLWGIMALRAEHPVLSSVLFALATACVPTYAVDIVIVWAALFLTGEKRAQLYRVAAATVGLSFIIYSLIFVDVVQTAFAMVGSEATATLSGFVAALHG